jgi:hypothetical protein
MAADRPQRPLALPHERQWFRPLLGLICVVGGIGGVVALYAFPIPTANQQPFTLALGIILGWGSAVVASEFGQSVTGRRLGEATVRALEKEITPPEDGLEGPSDAFRG